jgi:APA family basic amino acid/polyamine antiporter
MPIGILASLLICTVLYFLFAHVMTGVANYTEFKGHDGIAPVAIAIEHMGHADASGLIHPDYPWLNRAIILAILAGYSSVIMVMLLGQSRVFYSMSKDGLLPKLFSEIHPKFRTPAKSNLLFLLLVSVFAALVPSSVAGEMTSIGTLLAFILVCIGIIVLRKKMPNVPRAFKTPFVPFVPICGVLTCLSMMVFLPADTWIRLLVWMLIGLDIYAAYGMKNSKIAVWDGKERSGQSVLNITGVSLSVILIFVAFAHQITAGWESNKILLITALVLSVFHIFIFGIRLVNQSSIPAIGRMKFACLRVVNKNPFIKEQEHKED